MSSQAQRPEVGVGRQPQSSNHAGRDAAPPISVDRALQFSPLTTSVVSAHYGIPLPHIGRAKQTSRITTSAERKSILKSFENQPLNEVKERLNILLNPDALAEIKFKPPSYLSQTTSYADTHQTDPKRSQLHLSPAARMVLDMVAIDYRYPTPSSPSSDGVTTPAHASQPRSLPTPAVSRSPETKDNRNRDAREDLTPVSPSQPATKPNHNFFVEILGTKPNKNNFVSASGSPKRRKIETQGTESVSLQVRSHTDIVKSSLLQFQNLLLGLFEAHEALESESLIVPQDSEYFRRSDEDETSSSVTKPVLERLHTAAKQLVNYKALDNIPFEHLRRLQRICEPSVESSQAMNLRIDSDPNEDELAVWRSQLATAEAGVLSACVILWSILADPHDPNLVPEDVVKWVPNVLNNIFENCLIPIIESRPEAKNQDLFKASREAREPLRSLLDSAQRLLDVASTVCVQVRDGETAVNAIEFLAVRLIFVENASSDKTSVLGIQAFEKVRKTAMSSVAKIYARFAVERPAVLREILHSRSKLPSTNRSARQYKTTDGKDIQLFTALVMQLVQTTMLTSSKRPAAPKGTSSRMQKGSLRSDGEEEFSDEEPLPDNDDATLKSHNLLPLQRLQVIAKPMFDDGARSAFEIITELVKKASTTSKTGEDNSRTLFDFFVEDLLVVLSLPDWPAAELLLKLIAQKLIDIANSRSSGASATNMALENLGKMGSAISSIKANLGPQATAVSQDDDSANGRALMQLADSQSHGAIRMQDLIGFHGPYHFLCQYLQRSNTDNLRRKSAFSFELIQWSMLLSRALNSAVLSGSVGQGSDPNIDMESAELVYMLLQQISTTHPEPLEEREQATEVQARLSYTLIVLNSGFCRRLGEIVKTLSTSFGSDQAQVRSRSIKSVFEILQTDSSLLDRDTSIIEDVFACAADDSAMVRDSALSLIAKFIITRPALEEKGIKRLLDCVSDSKIGVQKKSMGHLKDIYLRDDRLELKAAITATILKRLGDQEETVSDGAVKSLMEMWISPYVSRSSTNDTANTRVGQRDLSNIIVKTIAHQPQELTPLLDEFLGSVLKAIVKSPTEVLDLFADIVADLVDSVITGREMLSEEHKFASLITLQTFAKQHARSVTSDQLRALRPYLSNIARQEDLQLFRPVVAIFKFVLPFLPSTQKPLVQDIQDDLMKSIAKMKRRLDLDEVMSCLWAIDKILGNTEKLVRLAASVLRPVMDVKTPTQSAIQTAVGEERTKLLTLLERHKNYVRIVGSVVKHWDLKQHFGSFKQKIPGLKVSSVAGLAADLIWPLTHSNYTIELRALSLECLGSICQASPDQFKKDEVTRSFRKIFHGEEFHQNQVIDLEVVALLAFAELLGSREERKEASNQTGNGTSQPAIEKMGGDTQEHDAAASQIAQRFFTDILNAALTSQGEKALVATRVIASINRQGLVHPKQCVGPLLALETSENPEISNIAFESHKMMHQQHESTYEREYSQAFMVAFNYSRNTLHDCVGATKSPYVAKLIRCFDVVNTSTSKFVKKFLSNLVSITKMEVEKLENREIQQDHLLFSRFVLHNIAFFEYTRIDDLLHTILQIEMQFSKGGAELVAAIESALHLTSILTHTSEAQETITAVDSVPTTANGVTTTPPIDPRRLQQLTSAAVVMTMLWETRSYLKRQYGIQQDVRQSLQQNKQAKAADKPPPKVYGVSGDQYWNTMERTMASVATTDAMMARCKDFLEVMSIDTDVKVAVDDDGFREMLSASIEMDDDNALKPPTAGRGKKRKSTASATSTPQKKRGRPSLKAQDRRGSTSSREGGPDADYEGMRNGGC